MHQWFALQRFAMQQKRQLQVSQSNKIILAVVRLLPPSIQMLYLMRYQCHYWRRHFSLPLAATIGCFRSMLFAYAEELLQCHINVSLAHSSFGGCWGWGECAARSTNLSVHQWRWLQTQCPVWWCQSIKLISRTCSLASFGLMHLLIRVGVEV